MLLFPGFDFIRFNPMDILAKEDVEFLNIRGEDGFNLLALDTFRFQARNNPVYREYLELLSIDIDRIDKVSDIPFLPIGFFKTHKVYCGDAQEDLRFFSSGTSGMQPSIHYVRYEGIYIESFLAGFSYFFGSPRKYCFLALLPSYLERENSSLVFMMDRLIRESCYEESGFYLNEFDNLNKALKKAEDDGIPVMLVGVSYALLDLAGKYPLELKNTNIVETGGMKGRREELSRHELHRVLSHSFGTTPIYSEYGMTELLSQAWSKGGGLFEPPPWMKVFIRDPYDPFSFLENGRTGGINIIDLANRYSCSFIETQDLGRLHSGRGFEVTGRFDNSDIRGCNLLVQ